MFFISTNVFGWTYANFQIDGAVKIAQNKWNVLQNVVPSIRKPVYRRYKPGMKKNKWDTSIDNLKNALCQSWCALSNFELGPQSYVQIGNMLSKKDAADWGLSLYAAHKKTW